MIKNPDTTTPTLIIRLQAILRYGALVLIKRNDPRIRDITPAIEGIPPNPISISKIKRIMDKNGFDVKEGRKILRFVFPSVDEAFQVLMAIDFDNELIDEGKTRLRFSHDPEGYLTGKDTQAMKAEPPSLAQNTFVRCVRV